MTGSTNKCTINNDAFAYAIERNKGATYSDAETAFREFLEWYLHALSQPLADTYNKRKYIYDY